MDYATPAQPPRHEELPKAGHLNFFSESSSFGFCFQIATVCKQVFNVKLENIPPPNNSKIVEGGGCPSCGASWSDPNVPHLCQVVARTLALKAEQRSPAPAKGTPSASGPKASSTPTAPVAMLKVSPVGLLGQTNSSSTSSPNVPSNDASANASSSTHLDIPTPTSIEVLIRVRPLLGHESDEGSRNATSIVSTLPDNQTIAINHPTKQLQVSRAYLFMYTCTNSAPSLISPIRTSLYFAQCKYDFSFPPKCSQVDIYDRVSQCATALANGFNATIFAYGQTGSGKTHTMFGPDGYDVRRASYGGPNHAVINESAGEEQELALHHCVAVL